MGRGFYARWRAVLFRHGCPWQRQGRGSHEIWFSPVTGRTFPVAVTVVSRHTANAILGQAGIDERL